MYINNIDNLLKLETPLFKYNRIGKIENILHLDNLKVLDMYGNNLTKIGCLEKLLKLDSVNLNRNFIPQIDY